MTWVLTSSIKKWDSAVVRPGEPIHSAHISSWWRLDSWYRLKSVCKMELVLFPLSPVPPPELPIGINFIRDIYKFHIYKFYVHSSQSREASLVAQLVKNPPAVKETPVWFLGQENPLGRDRLPTPAFLGFPGSSAGKEFACSVGDLCSILGLGRSPGEGNNYPLHYSGLENSMMV